MKLKLGLAVMAFTVAATGFAVANDKIIGLRQQIMKANGAAAGVAVGMLKSEIPFDATVAAAAAGSIAGSNAIFFELFPAGTETGANTKALETIWSDPEGFKAASLKTVDAANAAAAAAAEGPEAFGAAFQALGAACGACHETYRQK
ncbi:MAG: cytochrome c [Hyphomicrobiales bacterium]|nr:cytochrome c [Hyphomicrobiales bacterium]